MKGNKLLSSSRRIFSFNEYIVYQVFYTFTGVYLRGTNENIALCICLYRIENDLVAYTLGLLNLLPRRYSITIKYIHFT